MFGSWRRPFNLDCATSSYGKLVINSLHDHSWSCHINCTLSTGWSMTREMKHRTNRNRGKRRLPVFGILTLWATGRLGGDRPVPISQQKNRRLVPTCANKTWGHSNVSFRSFHVIDAKSFVGQHRHLIEDFGTCRLGWWMAQKDGDRYLQYKFIKKTFIW